MGNPYIYHFNQGETELKQFLMARACDVEDVSNNPQYWHKDIDLIVTNPKANSTFTVEVKWDKRMNETGNLYIEMLNPRSQKGYGWFHFCEADYLAYGDAVKHLFYIFDWNDLREYVREHRNELIWRRTYDDSQGILLPLDEILNRAVTIISTAKEENKNGITC